MKIDFENVRDAYRPGVQAIPKGSGKYFCSKCHKTLDEKQFFKTSRVDKHPAGVLPECKTCATMVVDDTDPSTFLPLLKEIDVPYIPGEWRALLMKKDSRSSSILGKYVSKMRLNQFKKRRWADSEWLVAQESESLLAAMRQETDTETEAEQKVDEMLSFGDIKKPEMGAMTQAVPAAALYGLTPETSKYGLSQEEIDKLKLDWGEDYTEDEFLKFEQLLNDMKEAYIIQDPIAISNAKMICKMTIKMNKFLDIDDVESASKIARQLDLFIKSANLAPVQQKDRQQTTFAISQLAFLVEREGGFIPEFYIDSPNDKIDQILRDMQEYTEYLVRGESNIAEMVENTEAILAQEPLPDAVEDYDDFAALEKELLGDIEAIEEGQEEITGAATDKA